ncbi:hypothetical protein M433DRAFT_75659 [Acidomyces richmondensis BFW]|nr:hypothetical protein M433DRAFT_75659 [Acidomyces richmondensis BFW]
MATIKAIEGRSVHQIQSGQVIVDLKSVIKELVENSLDAGASSIDVRFKNYGLDCIDVQDNGKGISPDDYGSLALKHHTSKLSSYEDLASLDTFGFRGEALSSLCAVSKFHVITARAEDGVLGKRLDFEQSGRLKSATVTAAQKGTTVTVEKLFHNLPVRRKELEKNIKREYGKVIELLHAYACIGVGVRFSVSNQPLKGSKVMVFSTRGNSTTKENIVNVFGAKTLLALIKLDLHLEMEPSKGSSAQNSRNWANQAPDRSKEVLVEGHISKPVFGEGRQAPDRQMIFVNSRPCSLPQVSKAINEVYKSFNVSQSPFIFANLIMDTTDYDVNVSPDKRVIMLHDQTALLESLKTSLIDLFEQTDQSVPQCALLNKKLPAYQPLTMKKKEIINADMSDIEDYRDAETTDDSKSTRLKPAAREPIVNCSEESRPPSIIQHCMSGGTIDCDADGMQGCLTERTDTVSLATPQETDSNSAASHDAGSSRQYADEHNPTSTECDDLSSQSPPHHEKPLEKSIAPICKIHFSNNADRGSSFQTPPPESPIPAVATTSQKGHPGPITNAFDRMRPKRTSVQTAEITVGSITTRTTIGASSAYKRRRIHEPKNSQAIARFGGSPQHAKGLKNFVAPGSRIDDDSGCTSSYDYQDEASERGDEEDTPGIINNTLPEASADDEADNMYIDERQRRVQEEQRVAQLIRDAEETSSRPTETNLKRASHILKGGSNRKTSTLRIMQILNVTTEGVAKRAALHQQQINDLARQADSRSRYSTLVKDEINDAQAENRLSLTVSKSDFECMSIIGQFNLGFIIAVRPALSHQHDDELFIIDQHAADEKYNFERLQRTVTLQSQRLVHPKPLELTAVQEEVILSHSDALKANGFEVELSSYANDNADGSGSVGRHCRLLTLPISGGKTFDPSDFEELVHLLSEAPLGSSEIPRPKKVQRILAMRACRSSIMVGKTLTHNQMQKVVRNMGEMEKPWNCPHGRPTMRHLASLGTWSGWREGESVDPDELSVDGRWYEPTDWETWLDDQR